MPDILNKADLKNIVSAIADAESMTSGEIRVHLVKDRAVDDPYALAVEWFERLEMAKTRDRNGVLLLVAPKARKLAIVGDEGIDKVMGQAAWDGIRDGLITDFKAERYAEGIIKAVTDMGRKLKEHFPHQDDDQNELSDEVSIS